MTERKRTLSDWLTVPVDDPDQARRGFSLNAMLLGLLPVALVMALWHLAGNWLVTNLGLAASLVLVSAVAYRLARAGRPRPAAWLYFAVFSLLLAIFSLANDPGLGALVSLYWLSFVVVGAAMTIDGAAALYFAGLELLLLLGVIAYFWAADPAATSGMALRSFAWPALMIVLLAVLARRIVHVLDDSLARARRNRQRLQEQLEKHERLLDDVRLRLAPMAEQFAASMEQLNSASEQIVYAVAQTAQGSEAQAFQAGEAAGSVGELAHATGRIADNARQTEAASAEAQRLMQNSVQVIVSLGDQLNEIDRVVRLVDKIADQTNLLALNASIEAARAGEHGAGFAVVADEVRRLAEHSAGSVRDISTMSQQINQRLEQVLAVLGQMQEEVTRTARLARETAATTQAQEQSASVVVGAVNKMAALTENNAAASEEIAATVEEQAASMDEVTRAAQVLAELVAELQATLFAETGRPAAPAA